MAEIGHYLGVAANADAAIDAVAALANRIGIPQRLRDLGVTETMLKPMAEKTVLMTRILRVNPRQPSVDDLMGILRAAF
jgi:alcohol dehydrogenase class IV